MSKIIQIRNVPDALHAKLKARDAMAGMSLSDYLMSEIKKVAERPTLDEMLARLRALPPVDPPVSPADLVREERDRR